MLRPGRPSGEETELGLSAWKVMLVVMVVALLFLPRFIRMGGMLKGLAERFSFDGNRVEPQAYGYAAAERDARVIDGDTGLVVQPHAPPARLTIPERIGMALARLVKTITQRLSA